MSTFSRAEIRNILGDAHTEEIENRLIELHLSVVNPLKEQLNTYMADAEALPSVQKELDDLKAAGDGGYKEMYEAEAKAHQEYVQQIESEKETSLIDSFVLSLCNEAGIVRENVQDLIVKGFDRNRIQRDEEGNITNHDDLLNSFKTEYAGFVVQTIEEGTPPATPPSGGNGGNGLSRAAQLAKQYHENLYGAEKPTRKE